MFPFTTARLFFFEGVIILATASWLYLVLRIPRFRPRSTPLVTCLAVFVAVLGLAAALGVDLHRSWWSTPERGVGVFFHCVLLSYFVVLVGFCRAGEISLRRYLETSVWIALGVAALGFVQYFEPTLLLGVDTGDRVGSVWGNPAFLASYLLFHIFIGLSLLRESTKRGRLVLVGGVVFLAAVVFLTQTRGALLGLVAGVLVLLAYCVIRGSPGTSSSRPGFLALSPRIVSASFLFVILIFGGVFWLTRGATLWRSIPGVSRVAATSQYSILVSDRMMVWKIAWAGFGDRPVFGFGPENFVVPFSAHYNPDLLENSRDQTYFDKPHNLYLEYLATIGVVGLAAYLLVFVSAFATVRGPGAPFWSAATAAYLFQNVVLFDTPASLLPLVAVLAAIDLEYRAQAVHSGHVLPISYRRSAGIALGLACVAALYILVVQPLARSYVAFRGTQYVQARRPAQSLLYYRQAMGGPFNIYGDYHRADFAAAVDIMVRAGLAENFPDPRADVEEAIGAVDDVRRRHPTIVTNYILSAKLRNAAYEGLTRDPRYLEEAKTILDEALLINPGRHDLYYLLAESAILENDYKKAEGYAKTAIRLGTTDWAKDGHFYLGVAYIGQGKMEEGLAEIRRAVAMRYVFQNGTQARLVAHFFGDTGYYDEAITFYERAIALDPDDVDSRLKIGVVYFFKGDYETARELLRAVIAKHPELKSDPGFGEFVPVYKELDIAV